MTESFGLRSGFAWWLPICTAALATLIAVAGSQTISAAWDADVHLWARDGRSPSEYAELVLDRSVQEAATSGMMATQHGVPVLDDVGVELTGTLIRVTVRAARQSDAEALAISLAHAAVDESILRYGDEAGLDMLGLVRPGARKVAPATEWTAAWASAVGLFGGLTLAWLVARRTKSPSTTLGRLGRIGLRPIAVISAEAEQSARQSTRQSTPRSVGASVQATQERSEATDDAVMLANALNPLSGIVALVPLDEASSVTAVLMQTARTLAARGRAVIWLDSRRPAFEIEYGVPPASMIGTSWSPVERRELILRSALRAARLEPPSSYVLLLTDPLSESSTVSIAAASAGVILMARADASEEQLVHARLLLSDSRLLGVALTQAQSSDLHEFELAQMTE